MLIESQKAVFDQGRERAIALIREFAPADPFLRQLFVAGMVSECMDLADSFRYAEQTNG